MKEMNKKICKYISDGLLPYSPIILILAAIGLFTYPIMLQNVFLFYLALIPFVLILIWMLYGINLFLYCLGGTWFAICQTRQPIVDVCAGK